MTVFNPLSPVGLYASFLLVGPPLHLDLAKPRRTERHNNLINVAFLQAGEAHLLGPQAVIQYYKEGNHGLSVPLLRITETKCFFSSFFKNYYKLLFFIVLIGYHD